jgi:UDP-3-O-[3-hydroxymyristoyl] glucosamine N-acyltransferase
MPTRFELAKTYVYTEKLLSKNLRKEVTKMNGKLLVIAMRKAVAVCTVGLVLLVSASYADAQIVTNGSFEDPNIPFGSFGIFAAIPGWSLAFGCGIEIQDHSAGSPHTGGQLVELDSSCSSGIYQDLITTPGELYDLSFAYSPRPGVFDNRIRVMWDDTVIEELQGNGVGLSDTAWEIHDITCLSADSADGTRSLEFDDTSGFPISFGAYIDSVSVEEHAGTGCISNTATVDPTATVADDATVGPGAVIEAGATVDSGASIGAEAEIKTEAVISADTTIETRAVVGERTVVNQESTVMADAEIGSDSNIGKRVTMGSQAIMGPRVTVGAEATVGVVGETAETTVVADETSLGTRSTIWRGANVGPRVKMEAEATVGLQATVAEDVAMGKDSRVGDRAIVGPRVRVGRNATVGVDATVGADTTMGAYSAVGDGCCVPAGTSIKSRDTTTWASGSESCSAACL